MTQETPQDFTGIISIYDEKDRLVFEAFTDQPHVIIDHDGQRQVLTMHHERISIHMTEWRGINVGDEADSTEAPA